MSYMTASLCCEEQGYRLPCIASLQLSSNADHFQIFGIHGGAVDSCAVLCYPERFEFAAKCVPPIGVKGRKRLVNRSIVEPKEFHHGGRRKRIRESIVTPDQAEIREPLPQPFTHRGF